MFLIYQHFQSQYYSRKQEATSVTISPRKVVSHLIYSIKVISNSSTLGFSKQIHVYFIDILYNFIFQLQASSPFIGLKRYFQPLQFCSHREADTVFLIYVSCLSPHLQFLCVDSWLQQVTNDGKESLIHRYQETTVQSSKPNN